MAQASERPTLEPADDELTPELALVDPELAERARERLGDPPQSTIAPEPAVPEESAAEGEPAVVEQIPTAETTVDDVRLKPFTWRPDPEGLDETPTPRRRRGIGRALVVAVAVLGAIGVALVVPPLLLEDQAASLSVATPSVAATAPLDTAPSQPGSSTPATDEASGPEAPAAGGPRTFGWVPVEGARHYHVAFFRGKEKIYETWPRTPRLVLQPQWTFKGQQFRLSPGQYRWVVRPGFGARRTGRYGPAVVDASLLVRR
jgi:hypothetical protein